MSRKDDRPDAGGEGAGDQNRESGWLPGIDPIATLAGVNHPPLSPDLREMAIASGRKCLIPFLEGIPAHVRTAALAYLIDLGRHRWRKLRAARCHARKLIRAGNRIGSDTLPACLALDGFRRVNDFTRSLLVAALVCAWPEEFAGRETLRHPVAQVLIRTGWRPFARRPRRKRKP